MLFHFLNISQCVVCIFEHKKIYKFTNPLQREIFSFKKIQWSAGGENAWLSTAHFKIKTWCGCFYNIVFLMETDCLQKILDVIFISSYMSDKQRL